MFAMDSATSSEQTASSMKVEVKRQLAASDINADRVISSTQNYIIYSYTTSDSVAKHDSTGDKGVVSIDFSTGSSAAPSVLGSSALDSLTSGGSTAGSKSSKILIITLMLMLFTFVHIF